MNAEIQAAIEQIYGAFDDVPEPTVIEGCPCCVERKGTDVLLTAPLRQITPDQLTKYAASVFNTVGSEEDFLYLLPRILEISASDPSWWPDPEVISVALKKGGFHDWPAHRKAAVIRYYNAVLDFFVITDQSGWEIDSWMCALGRLFSDISPFLDRLANHPSSIVEYYEVNSESLLKGKLTNSFWSDAPGATYEQVIDWFNSKAIRAAIDTHYGI